MAFAAWHFLHIHCLLVRRVCNGQTWDEGGKRRGRTAGGLKTLPYDGEGANYSRGNQNQNRNQNRKQG